MYIEELSKLESYLEETEADFQTFQAFERMRGKVVELMDVALEAYSLKEKIREQDEKIKYMKALLSNVAETMAEKKHEKENI